MERKAKLLSPLLIAAMVVSLVAGAVAVVVSTQSAVAQAVDLEVEITTPADGADISVCTNFPVKATITNNGTATATNVTANISFDSSVVEWVAGDGSTPPHEQDVADELDPGCSVEVMWTLHCTNGGVTSITVWADAENAPVAVMDQVAVNQLIKVEIIDPDPDCAGFEACPSQNFTVRAAVTNTGSLPLSLNGTGVRIVDAPNFTAGIPSPNPAGATFDPGQSRTYVWSVHCDAMSDDIIRVEVYNDQGVMIGYDEYAYHQRGLMVDIVMPAPEETFCVSNDFYVNAVVTNTCSDTIHDVTANLSGANPYNTGGGYKAELENADETFLKEIGDIPGKLSRDVMWKLHCTGVGRVSIMVTVEGETAWGAPVSDSDSVGINQGTGLTVEIVEPPFEWSPDGFTVCVCQTFVVKAHIKNIGCDIDATSVTANLTIASQGGSAVVIDEDLGKLPINVGTIYSGDEVIVGWTLHCTGAGDVLITVSAQSSNQLSGSDSVTVHQGDPDEPNLTVTITEPKSSTKISTGCDNVFTVTAVLNNPSCAPLLSTFAELLWECGPGTIYVNPVERIQSLGDIPGPGTATVSWEVTCTGRGDVILWVEAWAGNYDPTPRPASAMVTVHQLDFITKIVAMQRMDSTPLNMSQASYLVSTCQQFTVTAKFENNGQELVDVQAILDYSRIGAVLVDTPVLLSYHKNVSVGNPDGVLDTAKGTNGYASIPAIDTVPFGEDLTWGVSTVELERLCTCCYALVTWTLECVGAVSGDLEARAQTAGGIFLDDDSVNVIQQWKVHLVAGLEAFPGKLSDKTLVTVPSDTFTICQYFTVVATVTNIGQATATNVAVEVTVTGDPAGTVDPAGTWTKIIDMIYGGQSGKVWWELHCDGEGDVIVEITDLSGVDANTAAPVLEDNIDVLCSLLLHQVVGEIIVEIIQPATCDTFYVDQEFTVKALVTNAGAADIDVMADINWTGPALAIDEEPGPPENPTPKDLGTIRPGRTHEVAWVLRCTSQGDVTITVSAIIAMPELVVTSAPVIVHQVGPSYISCAIVSPWDCDDTAIATGQEFALTVWIGNSAGSANVTIYEIDLDIETVIDSLPWASVVAGPSPAPPFVLAGGQGKLVTWTLRAERFPPEYWEDHCLDIDVEIYGTDVFNFELYTECDMEVSVYPAAHLVVDITAPADGTTVTVCDTFTVTATVTNTGWADAWDVSAILSVLPEGSVRVTSGGYTKYNIGPLKGTLVGYDVNTSATVSWEVHCKAACESTITVTAAGRDELGYFAGQIIGGVWVPADVLDSRATAMTWGEEYDRHLYPGIAIPSYFIEPESITVKQMEAAALMVENVTYPTNVEVCQNFTVDAIVKNVGGSAANSVMAEVHISPNLEASVVGSATASLGNIAVGGFALVSWVVHCDGEGSGAIAVSADGTNTSPAVSANGSVIQVEPPVPQPCLVVEVDAPAQITMEQSYFVTAVVSNPCDGQACDVVATISISGPAERAAGETASKTLGCLDPGDAMAVDWEVDVVDVGGVNIAVTAEGTGTNTAVGSAAVQQVEYIDLPDLLAESLEDVNAALASIDGNMATLTSDIGTIKTDTAGINLTVSSIDDGVATIVTDLGTLNGTVDDISDGVATISTDLGVVKADVSGIAGDTDTLKSRSIWTLPILILVAIGAVAVIVGLIIVAMRKRPVPVVIERKEE